MRRSVSNNLNDIAKDHPEVVLEVATRWFEGVTPQRKRLVEHGLRTLLKRGGELQVNGARSPMGRFRLEV